MISDSIDVLHRFGCDWFTCGKYCSKHFKSMELKTVISVSNTVDILHDKLCEWLLCTKKQERYQEEATQDTASSRSIIKELPSTSQSELPPVPPEATNLNLEIQFVLLMTFEVSRFLRLSKNNVIFLYYQ